MSRVCVVSVGGVKEVQGMQGCAEGCVQWVYTGGGLCARGCV